MNTYFIIKDLQDSTYLGSKFGWVTEVSEAHKFLTYEEAEKTINNLQVIFAHLIL